MEIFNPDVSHIDEDIQHFIFEKGFKSAEDKINLLKTSIGGLSSTLNKVTDDGTKFTIWRIDPNGIMLSADEKPSGPEFGKFTSPEHGSTHSPEDFIRPR